MKVEICSPMIERRRAGSAADEEDATAIGNTGLEEGDGQRVRDERR